jgi:hypothetical protein
MKKMIFSACACFAVALLCFGFLRWKSGTIASDPVQVVKLTPCQYRASPHGKLIPGVEETDQSLTTGRLYGPTLCESNSFHLDVGDDVMRISSTVPGLLPHHRASLRSSVSRGGVLWQEGSGSLSVSGEQHEKRTS